MKERSRSRKALKRRLVEIRNQIDAVMREIDLAEPECSHASAWSQSTRRKGHLRLNAPASFFPVLAD
jgi:hypothetical protein